MLKLLAIAFVILQIAFGKTLRDKVIEYWSKKTDPYVYGCLQEAQLDVNDLIVAYGNNRIPETVAMGCYFKCIYQKLGVLESDGNVNSTALRDKDAPFLTNVALEECSKQASFESELCKKGFAFADCMVKVLMSE